MTEIKVIRDDEKATKILKMIRQIDDGAELAPVVRGLWIEKKRWSMGKWHKWLECSKCGHQDHNLDMYEDIPFTTTSKYCPDCGAKMDLKEV